MPDIEHVRHDGVGVYSFFCVRCDGFIETRWTGDHHVHPMTHDNLADCIKMNRQTIGEVKEQIKQLREIRDA